MTLILKEQTKEQFLSRFRNRYISSEREDRAKLSKWLIDRLDTGDFNDTEIRNSFGMSVVEWVSFRNELNALRTSWLHIQNARGK